MRAADVQTFLRTLTPVKIANAARVVSSYHWSRRTRRPVQWGLPFNMSVEPTTTCNLGCPECPSGLRNFTRPTGTLDMDLYHKLLDEHGHRLLWLYFYFQGEPYLHPRFLDLVREASRRNIYSVTSTNAHFLTERTARQTVESGLSRIILSLDGTTQDVYEQYRKGGTMQKVVDGAKRLVAAKKELGSTTPHIILQFLVVGPNEHQIDDVRRLGTEIGVDEVKFKTAQIYDYENGNPLIPTNEKYSRYRRNDDGTYSIKNPLHDHCWKLWHSCVMTWDGRIVPCCFDKDAQYTMGSLADSDLRTIWWNERYARFRERLLSGRREIDICRNCTEGLRVWME